MLRGTRSVEKGESYGAASLPPLALIHASWKNSRTFTVTSGASIIGFIIADISDKAPPGKGTIRYFRSEESLRAVTTRYGPPFPEQLSPRISRGEALTLARRRIANSPTEYLKAVVDEIGPPLRCLLLSIAP
jgi:hypothetical protein